MAYRSLLISFIVTLILGYSFTVGLTDPDSLLKKIPEWLSIPLLLTFGFLYLLATWWAFKGFHEHKLAALTSLCFCAFGLGVYALAISMELGHGKALPGQYDYKFSTLDPSEKLAMENIARNAGVNMDEAVFSEHWHLPEKTKSFRICVQKGHVTGLNLSNHPISDLTLFSKLPHLDHLFLKNCGLSDLSGLRINKLDRLDVSDNQITDLKTLSGCPNIRWLFLANNQLTSFDGIGELKLLISKDLTGNPIL
jgi:hypothetical protein